MNSQSIYVSWGLWNGLGNKLNESKMLCALKRPPTNSDNWHSLIQYSLSDSAWRGYLMCWPTTWLVCRSIHYRQSPLGLMTVQGHFLIPTFANVTHWQCHWAMHFPRFSQSAVPLGHVFSLIFRVFLMMGLRLFGLIHPEYAISEHLLVTGSNNPLIISGFINLSQ